MIRYVLQTAVAALALAAPGGGYAQSTAAQPMAQPLPVMTTNASATISGQPQPGPNDDDLAPSGQPINPAAAQPMPPGYMQPGFTPRTVWIPGSYNWDPVRQSYVWTDGRFVEAPRDDARWVPGHWSETPTAWIWIDGRWM